MDLNLYHDKINRYLDSEMTVKEQVLFEQEIEKSLALKEEVRQFKLEREALEVMLFDVLQGEVKMWQEEVTTEEKKIVQLKPKQTKIKVRNLWQSLAAAATVALLIVAGGWWMSGQYTNDALAMNAYVAADLASTKSGDAVNTTAMSSAIDLFSRKDYQGTIIALNSVPDTSKTYAEAQYYMAHSHFNMQQFDTAIEKFNLTLQQKNQLPSYINTSKLQWDALIAHLANDQLGTTFDTQLEDLIQNGAPPYNKKATALKQQLNNFWRFGQ